jgi:hypothetical protein
MFIPQGRAIHENLATSYVLVDSLVEDLCEGGFTGIVEVVLRDSDCHIVVNRGKVVAVTDRRGSARHSPTTLPQIAARSRQERGRISVYGYSQDTAAAVAGGLKSEPLYTQLSTEFVDLGRMLRKFQREHDREWFIEVRVPAGPSGLVYLSGERCLVVSSKPGGPRGHNAALETSNPALAELMEEVRRLGATFDVSFKRAESKIDAEVESAPDTESDLLPVSLDRLAAVDLEGGLTTVTTDLRELLASYPDEPGSAAESKARLAAAAGAGAPPDPRSQSFSDTGAATMDSDSTTGASPETVEPLGTDDSGVSHTGFQDVSGRLPDELDHRAGAAVSAETGVDSAERMAEVKRLMAEITRTVENAARPAELKDGFSINLRAGQLKVADRYPFLDPFGSEFEYMEGEIVFVGAAGPEEFIEGLTEAIQHAIDCAAESSSHSARLRSRLENDLRSFMEANRQELEKYGLCPSIERLVNS